MRRTPQTGGLQLNGLSKGRLACADDVDIMAETLDDVHQTVRIFKEEAERVGLTINHDKNKSHECSMRRGCFEDKIRCAGMELEAVQDFKLQGSFLTSEKETTVEVLARMQVWVFFKESVKQQKD